MAERRTARVQQKVVHRHRIGAQVFKRVSDFVFVRGEPKAILRWKYNPKVEEGRAVERRGVRVVLRFDLED